MNWFEPMMITIFLAFLGQWVLSKLSFPAAVMMGPVFFIGGFQIWSGSLPQLPVQFVDVFQIILGLSAGAKINKNKLAVLNKIAIPALLVVIWTVVFTLLMTIAINYYSSDLITAFFSAAPGGINVIATMALAYHSEVAVVSTYQFVRLLVILSVVPLLAQYIKQKITHSEGANAPELEIIAAEPAANNKSDLLKKYGVGVLGGLLLTILHFPAGGIIGSMFGMAAMNIFLGKETVFPPKVMQAALIGIGASVGLEFSPLMAQKIQQMFGQILAFSLIIVISNFILAYFIHRITRWDIITCLLSSTSGGLNQMLIVGDELQANTVVISVLQLVRLLLIVTCVPLVSVFITG
ncbi:MAG: AbrB family transcriptional regulator [Syntrophomonas sp.]|nr:AbrB family transcriptional regulator [Syntrophomonas sp.]